MSTAVESVVWNGHNGQPCNDPSKHGGCDLLVGHDGPHFVVLDHDDDGDPCLVAIWPASPSPSHGEPADG